MIFRGSTAIQLTRWLLPVAWLAVSSCASTPDPIRDAEDGPPLGVVREAPQRFIGERVRWGGTIANVENDAEQTRVYIVARELQSSGRPARSDFSTGRFVALLAGFHDPVILAPGRELTVVGVLHEAMRGTIGEFDYVYPVVNAETHRLWPKREPSYNYYRPPYHPYYYDPWYPYPYPYPYFPHRHYH
ncbi:MAG: Slp family lipoprotein [Gammaproteobacteria bacterium]|nr:Slp family lipoprotein [Gammaproteobacteria bacterium]